MEENKNVSSGVEKAEKINGSSKKPLQRKQTIALKTLQNLQRRKLPLKKPLKKITALRIEKSVKFH